MGKKKTVFFSKLAASGIYDNASVVYSLRRPDMAGGTLWTNAVLKIRRGFDSATVFVFFDGSAIDDTITLNSLISTTSNTTPDATTLSTWITGAGSENVFVEEWIGITPNNIIDANKTVSQAAGNTQPQFMESGVIKVNADNGLIALDCLTGRFFEGTANSDLDYGESFGILSVSNNTLGGNNRVVWSNRAARVNGVDLFNSRKTSSTKQLARIITDDGSFEVLKLVTSNTDEVKLFSMTVHSSTIKGYFNGASQGTTAFTNTYPNVTSRVGVGPIFDGIFYGMIQEVILMKGDITADLTALHAEINAYYSIY